MWVVLLKFTDERYSILQAGIPDKNLLVALEPECAALYCQNLFEQKMGFNGFKETGSKYLILDNGGKLKILIFLK